jgi:hypothetical protein
MSRGSLPLFTSINIPRLGPADLNKVTGLKRLHRLVVSL